MPDVEDMVEVRVAIRCHYTPADGGFIVYEPGLCRMPKSHAEHWFVAQHLENPPPAPPPAPGSWDEAIKLARSAQVQKEQAAVKKELATRLQRAREQEEADLAMRNNMGYIKSGATDAYVEQQAKDMLLADAVEEIKTSSQNEEAQEPVEEDEETREEPAKPVKPAKRVKLKSK